MALVVAAQDQQEEEEEEEEERGFPATGEERILARVAANHLFLGQFEAFRGTLKTLAGKNLEAAVAMLRAVVAVGGRLPGFLVSRTVPSPAHLAWMCVLELEEFDRELHSVPNIGLIKELVELMLLLEQLESEIAVVKNREAESPQERSEVDETGEECIVNEAESRVDVEPGFTRDIANFYLSKIETQMNSSPKPVSFDRSVEQVAEKMQGWIEFVTVCQPDLMAAICRNIHRQKELSAVAEGSDVGLVIQQQVQRVHLNCIKSSLDQGIFKRNFRHLKYLDESYAVSESEYSDAVSILARLCRSQDGSRKLLASAYEGILCSGSTRLLSVLEDCQDTSIHTQEGLQMPSDTEAVSFPRPFWKLHERIDALRTQNLPLNDDVIAEFLRDVFHHARVKREHVFEKATETALAAVKALQHQVAADVLVPFPRLQPLVAAMGWDLLRGNTAARRSMMELLWYKRSMLSKDLTKHVEEVSCIENLCDQLCYNLEVAYFVADLKSGVVRKFDSPRLLTAESEDAAPSDLFAANLMLERLAEESSLRVMFDMIPNLELGDAVSVLNLQPVSSSLDLLQRDHDLELLHMRYALQAAAMTVIAIQHNNESASSDFVTALQNHLKAIKSPVRRIWMLGITVLLLQMEEGALRPTQIEPWMQETMQKAPSESEEQPVMNFLRRILELIRRYLPSAGFNIDSHRNLEAWKEAWESERIRIGRFVDDWSWRLRVLERLILRPGEQLSWKSALTVLHSEPGTLLNMCIQQAQYDLAKDAVNRFALPCESAAILQLTEWLHSTVTKGKVISLEDLKGFIFAKYLSPLSSVVLCLDVAATYAPSYETSKLLLEQARGTLSQEAFQKKGAEQFLPVLKRIIQRFHDLLEQWQSQPLPAILSSADPSSGSESLRQGPKQRALIMLHQIIDDAHNGKGQFLSGKLHNLVKAFADEELDDPSSRLGNEKKQYEQGFAVGLGFRASLTAGAGTSSPAKDEPTQQIQKTTGKRFWGPLVNKPTAYLSAFILYVATIGDIVDGVDTTHDFNFFSLLYERPGDLLTRLVFERGSTDGAAKVAEIMGADLVHQVISACVPPVFPPRASSNSWTNISTDSNISDIYRRPEYQLDLDTIKYLTSLSPVRSILACVFGSKESKIGHDYAVEQAERFPTLQRWIQMQANLQRLRDSAIFPAKSSVSGENKSAGRTKLKRRRDTEEEETECESVKQIQENEGSSASTTNLSTVQVWEDEYPYEEAVEGLIKDGKLVDALAFADRWLKDGAPDKLLQLLIERGEDTVASSSNWQGLGGHHNLWNSSWQYCIRLKDKRLAATLALKYLHRWELDAAIDVLTMCSCHLPSDDVLCEEVLRMKKHLQQYRQILREDSLLQNWQDIESWCERDPEGLALRLAEKGAVTAALDIAESFKLSDDLRRELQGRQLVKLLTVDPINGGGPAEALRFLGSLNRPEDALPVAMAAMEQLPNLEHLPNLHSKQLLVHFLLKRQIGFLSEEEHTRMDKLALGLKMLGALPLPWQQRCAGLHEHPELILETLLMWKQFQAASQLLEAFPSLRNDKLIITYASKAIHVTGTTSGHQAASKMGCSNKLNASNGTNRRMFFWASRDTRNKIIPKDSGRKRKSTLPPSQKAAWEAMAGYQELAQLTMVDEWVLSGDPVKDESVRSSHKYESAPSFVLFKALLSLCFDQAGAAKSAVELAVSQVKTILSAECLPNDASSEAIERAFHAAGTLVQVLLDARTQLHKLLGNIEASSYSTEEPADASKNSSGENQSLNSLTKLLTEADVWLNRVELLHSLLGSGVTASVEDVADEKSALLLRDRLIQEERYGMAVYTCTKCKIDVFPVWEAWGYALLRIEHYAQARLKFKKALQLYKDDPSKVVQKIVETMEACPPADVPATRSLYMHMAKSVSSASDDSLSADSYLNVLYIPTFTRAERSRRSIEAAIERLTHFSADEIAGPLSNLDTTRYEECRYYMDEYARPLLLQFMFRHGRYGEACSLFFPLGTVPPAPAALSSGSSKLDSLATEYGCIEELCELCVAYGAIPILERTIEARMSSNEDAQVSQHTSAALTRICNYLEHQRHFNHLYRFQVLKKDYIAAGLCCIQLFINSSTQDQALRHLERAKAHFEEGLLVRQQVIENVKSGGKASRGKSPSEKLTDEDLIKFSARVTLQMEVLRCFNDGDVEPWKRSLFGNPNDTDTFKRRCEIAEALVEKNFDLAFQIIYDFGLPAVYIYAGVAALLAEKRKYNNLVELLRNIKGTIDNEDLDQIIGAAISVYANKHRERPDRLIDMLSSNHRKVLACVICGRLKSAFQIASRSGNVADVQWVAQQARLTGALPVEDMCKQWLARAS